MKIFAGLSRTDYEDVFRAVGALIDEQGWSNVSLLEVEEGLIVQVMTKTGQRDLKPRLETYLLTDTDIERVLRDAVMRRKKRELGRQVLPTIAPPAAPLPAPGRTADAGPAAPSGASGNGATWPSQAPAPPARPDPDTGDRAGRESADFSEISSQLARMPSAPLGHTPQTLAEAAPFPFLPGTEEEDATPFALAPMRLSGQSPEQKLDAGAARAAVVMAHIVAARIKSGVPLTSDDPDLASLLDQVRALDESGIGDKG